MPTCMTKPVLSTRILDSGGAPLVPIQDLTGMGLDIDQGTPIIIPVPAFLQVGRFLTPAGPALVLRLRRMPRHECSDDRTR
jgi:hypothetical protein